MGKAKKLVEVEYDDTLTPGLSKDGDGSFTDNYYDNQGRLKGRGKYRDVNDEELRSLYAEEGLTPMQAILYGAFEKLCYDAMDAVEPIVVDAAVKGIRYVGSQARDWFFAIRGALRGDRLRCEEVLEEYEKRQAEEKAQGQLASKPQDDTDYGRIRMTSEDAQSVFAEFVLRLIILQHADVVDEDNGTIDAFDWKSSLSSLSETEMANALNSMFTSNPALLDSDLFVQLNNLLGGNQIQDGVYVPVDARQIRRLMRGDDEIDGNDALSVQ